MKTVRYQKLYVDLSTIYFVYNLMHFFAADHLLFTLKSFYTVHEEYSNTPLYIFGQGHGAQLAVSLATKLSSVRSIVI